MGKYISQYQSEQGRFKELLEAAQDELVQLLGEKNTLDWKIAKLQNDIVHLAALANESIEDPVQQLGLTDIIRSIIAQAKKPVSYSEIAESMKQSGYKEYKNIHANIQTIVKRLMKSKEVVPSGDYKKFYWAGGPPPLAPPPSWLNERIEKQERAKEVSPARPIRREVL